MKVLFITNTPNSRRTGMGRMMHYLRDELVKIGHSVDLIFSEDVPRISSSRRISELFFPFLIFFPLWKYGRENGRYDLVAIHTLEGAVYTFLRKFFKRLPPCVIASYGADELRWGLEKEEERLGFRKISLRSKILYFNIWIRQARYATRHADRVIVSSRAEIKFYQKVYGMDPKNVKFIPTGVSPEFFIQRDYHRSPKRLLFLGGWEWRKGIRYLAEAFTRVAEEDGEVILSIAGTRESKALIQQSFPKSVHSRIHVPPDVGSAEELPRVYEQNDIFLFPSLFEGMSLVVPEAMASGMPVVTTRTCGMQDIIEDGVTGFLVPLRDVDLLAKRVTELLNDPSLCEKLGRAAQRKAEEITWDRIAKATLQVYEEVVR